MENLFKENYEFEYQLTKEETILRILDFIKNQRKDDIDIQNMILGYGVADKHNILFVTRIYYLSDCIKRCDDGIDDFKYVVVTKDDIFSVFCQSEYGKSIVRLEMSSHQEYTDIVWQAINYFHTEALSSWERKLKEVNPGFSLRKYNSELKEKYLS